RRATCLDTPGRSLRCWRQSRCRWQCVVADEDDPLSYSAWLRLQHQFGIKDFAFRLRADQQGKNDASRAKHSADHHGHRVGQMLLDGHIGNDRRGETAEYGADVVTETICSTAHLCRKAFA